MAATASAGVQQTPMMGTSACAGEELARPCSTLSLADLGELCGDSAEDDCGGAYLVGGDCDEHGDDGGIGLDLLDLDHEVSCRRIYTVVVELFLSLLLCCLSRDV